MATKNTYVSKEGTQVSLNLSNTTKWYRPGKYVYIDADMFADICVKLGKTEGRTDELFKAVMKKGLEAIGLNVEDYSLDRARTKDVRNKSINATWLAKYNAEKIAENAPAVADVTKATPETTDNTKLIDAFAIALLGHEKKTEKKLSIEEKIKIAETMKTLNGTEMTQDKRKVILEALAPLKPAPVKSEVETGFSF